MHKKGYSRPCRFLNTVIAAIYTVSQSLEVIVVDTHVPLRSDTGSCVADNLSKSVTKTVSQFTGQLDRRLLVPETIWELVF